MREYISGDAKPMKKSTRVTAIIAGFGFIVTGIFIWSIYSIAIGVILLAAMCLNKQTAMTEEGLVVTYDVVFYKYYERWAYDEIQEIHKELAPDGKRYALHVMKDVMSRRLIYSYDDMEKVIKLALEHNPNIHIADVD